MFRRVVGHIRRQPVAFVALFFALGGGALAANNFIRSTDTIPSGDLAGSTYGGPVIAPGTVTNGKLANSSLNVNPGTGLRGGGSVALGGSTTLGIADNGIDTTQLRDGSVTTSKFNSAARAPDSAKLGGANPTDYGAVLSGRINGLCTSLPWCIDAGAASGISTATHYEADVSTLSPAHDLVARDFNVQLTAAPGTGNERQFDLIINGTQAALDCLIVDPATRCSNPQTVSIPAGSTLAIQEIAEPGNPTSGVFDFSPADVRFAFRLTNS